MADATARGTPACRADDRGGRARLVVLGLVLVSALGLGLWLQRARDVAPRLSGEDPRDVAAAYFEARRLGLWWLAREVESDEARSPGAAAGPAEAWVDDAFLAADLRLEGPRFVDGGTREEEVRFVVTYRSRWPSETGQPPGPRFWFVRLGRDRATTWRVLGQGTGP